MHLVEVLSMGWSEYRIKGECDENQVDTITQLCTLASAVD